MRTPAGLPQSSSVSPACRAGVVRGCRARTTGRHSARGAVAAFVALCLGGETVLCLAQRNCYHKGTKARREFKSEHDSLDPLFASSTLKLIGNPRRLRRVAGVGAGCLGSALRPPQPNSRKTLGA